MELRYLLQLCRGHWRFLALVTAVATVAGLAATYVLPESFEAQTRILIRPEEKPTFDEKATKAMMDYPVGFNVAVESISRTYAEIMTSKAIATLVEDRLQIHSREAPEPEGLWLRMFFRLRDYAKLAVFSSWDFVRYGRIEPQLPPYQKTVKDIREGLEAEPISNTYVFELTATWSDPDTAVQIADTAASVFIEYSREARTLEEGTATGLLSESLAVAQETLVQARARLDALRSRTGSAALTHELALRVETLARFESERDEAAKELEELQAELQELEALLAGTTVAGTLHGEPRKDVEARLAERLARRQAVSASIAALGGAIGRYRTEAERLSSYQNELAQLELEVGLLEDNYRMIARKREESRIAAAQALSEIRVLHPATRPRYPSGPIKIFYAGGGLLFGLLLSLGLVLVIDYMDHRVRTRDEIEASLGVSVLAVMPHATLPAHSARMLGQEATQPAGLAWGGQSAGIASAAREKARDDA